MSPSAGATAVVARPDLRASAAWIAARQRRDGSIPWYADGPVDPWDHAEAAMGLAVGGWITESVAALDWMARTQRADGSWPARRVRGRIADATGEAHAAVHLAVAAAHLHLVTGDQRVVARWWPAVERAVGYVLGLALPSGAVRWARDPRRRPWPTALPTAASGTLLGLRCAVQLADVLGASRPVWRAAATRLSHALATAHPDVDAPGRHAMDWYWPVLAGAVTGGAGRARLEEGWPRFVEDGLGVRCVVDRPWVTAAETAEAAMACVAVGWVDRGRRLLDDIAPLGDRTGSWWTGWVWPAQARWPVERTTWTAGAVALAADALRDGSATRRLLAVAHVEGVADGSATQQAQAAAAAGVVEGA